VFNGVEVRVLCRPVKFFHTDLDKPFLYKPRLVHGAIVMLKQERAFPILFQQRLKHRISLYVEVLSCAFTGTKGPSLYHEKQPHIIIPPPPYFTVGAMNWDR
jgi:hypothetical protein